VAEYRHGRQNSCSLATAVSRQAALGSTPFQPGDRLANTIDLSEILWDQIDIIHRVSGAKPLVIYRTGKAMEKQLKLLLDKVFL
jgi:hypothetical protein